MEASTLQAPAALARHRIAIGIPLLRLRSDEQLVELFRAGHEEAFRVIHDRYGKRLLAYTRQMLPRGQDAEDALQDVFVRAYSGLRSSHRELALRAWLFRVAHNRCIDELRRPAPPPPEVLQLTERPAQDPAVEADRRESLRRLITDVRRLPEQQRSALLMREMGGMSYTELSAALGVSVPAVKSLLVRARIALTEAAAARDTSCSVIREELVGAHDRGVRPNATARRHMRDCTGCRSFRREVRTVNRSLAALVPLGPLGLLAKTLGFSSGAGAGSSATASGAGAGGATAGGATAGGGAAVAGGAASGGGVFASGAIVVGSGHVATLLAAAVATAGGAVAISTPSGPAKATPPPPKVQGASTIPAQAGPIASPATTTDQDAAAAVSVSLVAQTQAKSASQTTRADRLKQHSADASTQRSTPSANSSSSSSTASGVITDAGASVTATLLSNASSTATNQSTTPTTGDSLTGSTGSDPTGTGSSSASTSQPSSSSSTGTGSGTNGSSGTTPTTNNTNSGSGTGSGTSGSTGSSGSTSPSGSSGSTGATGTSSDPGSGTGATTPGSGTSSTPSK